MKLRTGDKVYIIDDKIVQIAEDKPMKMNIEDAVNYCLNHKAVIHTPSEDILYSLMKYLDKSVLTWRGGAKASSFNCYSRHKENTCIRMHKLGYMIDYSCINYFKDRDYDIIELTSVSIDNTIYYDKEDAVSKIESIFSSFPSAGDTYYFIDSEGKVTFDDWIDDDIDKNHLAIGNIYKTEEDASIALDRVIKAYKG